MVLENFPSVRIGGISRALRLARAPGAVFHLLCLTVTFAGCFISVDLVRWRINPVRQSMERLRSVLLELSEAGTTAEGRNSDPVAVAIDADKE